jgi:hypothetical protein
LVLVIATLPLGSVAFAQPQQARANEPEASSGFRALYLEGLAAFEQNRYAEATRAFRAAYELEPVPAALYSLATTLRAQDLYAEALRATRTLLVDHPDLDAELRTQAEALVEDLRGRVGTLALLDLPTAPAPMLQLDGDSLSLPATRPVELDVDPGSHRLHITAPGRLAFEWTGSIAAGARLELHVELPVDPHAARPRRATAPATATDTAPDTDAAPDTGPPWVMIGVIGALVVAAGIVIVVLALPDQPYDRSIEI